MKKYLILSLIVVFCTGCIYFNALNTGTYLQLEKAKKVLSVDKDGDLSAGRYIPEEKLLIWVSIPRSPEITIDWGVAQWKFTDEDTGTLTYWWYDTNEEYQGYYELLDATWMHRWDNEGETIIYRTAGRYNYPIEKKDLKKKVKSILEKLVEAPTGFYEAMHECAEDLGLLSFEKHEGPKA